MKANVPQIKIPSIHLLGTSGRMFQNMTFNSTHNVKSSALNFKNDT